MDYKLWINGEWTDSKGGGRTTIVNPATEEKIASLFTCIQFVIWFILTPRTQSSQLH